MLTAPSGYATVKEPMANTAFEVLKIILAIIFPPLAALLEVGLTTQFWVNILLTLLGYIPGQIHALWLIARKY